MHDKLSISLFTPLNNWEQVIVDLVHVLLRFLRRLAPLLRPASADRAIRLIDMKVDCSGMFGEAGDCGFLRLLIVQGAFAIAELYGKGQFKITTFIVFQV